jgi:hypothetical protein
LHLEIPTPKQKKIPNAPLVEVPFEISQELIDEIRSLIP